MSGHLDPHGGTTLPPTLAGHIALLADVLAAEPRVVSVLLTGHAARGELPWSSVAGRSQPFGAYELVAVTDGRLTAKRQAAIAQDAGRAVRDLGYASPRSGVRSRFRERRRLPTMLPVHSTYDLGTSGRLVRGADVRGEVRRVSARTLDRQNAHEGLISGLWSLVEAVPAWLLSGSGDLDAHDEVAARSMAVGIAEAALSVPTALLPERDVLLPRLADRVDHWREHEELDFRPRMDLAAGGDSGRYLSDCYAAFRHAGPTAAPQDDIATCAAWLRAAFAWLLKCSVEDTPDQVLRRSRSLFHELPVSPEDLLGLGSQVRSAAGAAGIAGAVRWIVSRRKGAVAAGLLHMCAALTHMWSCDAAAAETSLNAAWLATRTVRRVDTLQSPMWNTVGSAPRREGGVAAEETGERWLRLRWSLGRALWRTLLRADDGSWPPIEASLRAAAA